MGQGARPRLHAGALLLVVSAATALVSGTAGLLLGLPSWRAAALALVVPWALSAVAGAVLLVRRLPGKPWKIQRPPQNQVVVPREIDLRAERTPRLPLPRQDRQPLDDVGNRPGGAP